MLYFFVMAIQLAVCNCLGFISFLSRTEFAEANQELIVAEGGISLLSTTADDAEDPQTLRMVAGAIANLCGNGNVHLQFQFLLSSSVSCSDQFTRVSFVSYDYRC